MAWKGEADKEQESASGGGNKFPPAPRGIYTIQVADFDEGKTKDGKRDKVDLTCEVADEGEHMGKKVWVTITHIPKGQQGHGLMLHSLHAFGIGLDGPYEFDPKDLQGRSARALIGVAPKEKVKDGKTYVNETNYVEELYTEGHPEPEGELPPRKPAFWESGSAPAKKPAPSAAAQAVFGGGQGAPANGAKKKEGVPF